MIKGYIYLYTIFEFEMEWIKNTYVVAIPIAPSVIQWIIDFGSNTPPTININTVVGGSAINK